MSVINGPQAPQSNPPIEPQNFQPSRFPITAITAGATTTVTTGTAFGVSNNYVIGQLVRFLIPTFYGAQQLNGQQGFVISLPAANQVEVNIDTTLNFDPFIANPSFGPTKPEILAIGDTNSGPINTGRTANQTYINGSFINISPQ